MKGFSPRQMETVRPLVYFIFFIFSAVTSPRMHIRRLQCRRSSFLKVYTNCPLDKATIRCKEIYQAEKTLIIVIVEFCCYLFQIKKIFLLIQLAFWLVSLVQKGFLTSQVAYTHAREILVCAGVVNVSKALKFLHCPRTNWPTTNGKERIRIITEDPL